MRSYSTCSSYVITVNTSTIPEGLTEEHPMSRRLPSALNRYPLDGLFHASGIPPCPQHLETRPRSVRQFNFLPSFHAVGDSLLANPII
jgi:hypothetical protein